MVYGGAGSAIQNLLNTTLSNMKPDISRMQDETCVREIIDYSERVYKL